MHYRKKKTLEKYHEYQKIKESEKSACDFCHEEPDNKKLSFEHWKIIKNIFPYDRIAEYHDLLIPKRHFRKESEMTGEEREDLVFIKTQILSKQKKYDCVWENFPHVRSVEHYHVHLLFFKRSGIKGSP